MSKTPVPVTRRIGADLKLGPKLGTGAISKVRIGFRDGHEFAVKYTKIVPPRSREYVHKQFANELEALNALHHPRIVKQRGYEYSGWYVKEYKDHTAEVEVAYCLMDKARHGNLIDVICLAGAMNERIARFYFKQMVEAVKFMHESDYAHRNLKLNNMLLDEDCNLVVTGFRYAKRISSAVSKENDESLYRRSAMSPQSLQSKKCNPVMDDLFALGYVLFTMLYKREPFEAAEPKNSKYRYIFDHKLEDFWKIFAFVPTSPEAKDLISSMLAYEPSLRPSIYEIESSPWMQGETPAAADVQKELADALRTTEQRLRAEAETRKKKRASVASASLFGGHVVTRTLGGMSEPDELYRGEPRKRLDPLGEEAMVVTRVYSMEHPDMIEHALIAFLASATNMPFVDDKKYKVQVKARTVDGSSVRPRGKTGEDQAENTSGGQEDELRGGIQHVGGGFRLLEGL